MKTIIGNYASAKVMTNDIEEAAVKQILTICDQPFVKGSHIAVMPDAHAGKGCVIGTTMTITDRVCPNLVGVDIGCGMLVVELGNGYVSQWIKDNLTIFDDIVHGNVPSGFNVHEEPSRNARELFGELLCRDSLLNKDRILASLGTLGGGNHFIELDTDRKDNLYLVIHTGSRNLGVGVADYYQDLAIKDRKKDDVREYLDKWIGEMKAEGRQREIADKLKVIKEECGCDVPDDLCYLQGEHMVDYLQDMETCQRYTAMNRMMVASEIIGSVSTAIAHTPGNDAQCYISYMDCEKFQADYQIGMEKFHGWQTVHNYIDVEHKILRKGAVSAEKGEKLLIPMNMRDGSLICVGKGNPEWNYSAPHGAGRAMSRSKAMEELSMIDYAREMSKVFTSCVTKGTLDESPMAYKPTQEIIDCIGPTAEVIERITPIYNFKAE
jgi:tRNA-splicing ligase RtcB